MQNRGALPGAPHSSQQLLPELLPWLWGVGVEGFNTLSHVGELQLTKSFTP
jgi:hypothetical protein